MDPITTALLAGVSKLAEPAIKDAYEGIKTLIHRKFGATSNVARAAVELEKSPASAARREVLKEEVAAAEVDSDKDIITAANALLEKLKTLPGGQAHVQLVISGNHNIVTGTGDINLSGDPRR